MEPIKDGGSINRPLVLDGTNYDYWKSMIVDFLKSIDNKTWKVMIKGYKHLVITTQDGITSLKPKVDWSKQEDDEALGNNKVLNDI